MNRNFLLAAGAGLLCAFAPAADEVRLDGHLPSRTAVNYSFSCESGRIDIGYAQQLRPEAPAGELRSLRLLAFTLAGRTVPSRSFAEIAGLVQRYEWIEAVSAQCGGSGNLVTIRGMLKSDWQAHIAALEAHDGAPAGTARPDRPESRATDIRIGAAGAVEIVG